MQGAHDGGRGGADFAQIVQPAKLIIFCDKIRFFGGGCDVGRGVLGAGVSTVMAAFALSVLE